jgi:pimeloyl-ACP methyl ester carboxylesterase
MTETDTGERFEVRANGRTFVGLAYGDGEPVLALHGFPDDPRTFDRLAAELDGVRLLAPYMPGYGPTGGDPTDDYSPGALGREAAALAEALGTRFVVGHDWGAVAAYGALRSESVERAATMAVPPRFDALLFAYPRQFLRSWYIWLFQLPGGVSLLRARDFALVDALYGSWSPGFTDDAHVARAKETLATGGTAANAAAYYRDMVAATLERVSANGVRDPSEGHVFETPTLLLTGADDRCIGTELYDRADEAFERCRVVRVRDAGHFLHRERPGVVAGELRAWFA